MSIFSEVELGPPVEVFALTAAYDEDASPNKVNLGIGAYRTNEGKPWVLPVVRTAERALANDETLNKEYCPILGIDAFTNAVTKLILGEDSPAILESRAFGVHTIAGTGALRVGAEFLANIGKTVFYYSKPTWGNHKDIFKNAGFQEGREYRYWSESKKGLDIDGLLEDLRNAPEGSVIILHACAHNPTGCDPTVEQWGQIMEAIKEKQLFPFFDAAYHGSAYGDLDKDATAVRLFVKSRFEILCAQSFSKNFGLYNDRVGNLAVVVNNSDVLAPVKSQISLVIRGLYSNPPIHGARIITYVLNNPDLYSQWKQNIQTMANRIIDMRKDLRNLLETLKTPGDWSHITQQIGIFSFTGLNEIQSEHMTKYHHVYMLRSGRINMSGLTTHNVEYVARAISETITALPDY